MPNMIKVQLSCLFSSNGLSTWDYDNGLGEMVNNNKHEVGVVRFREVSDKVHSDGLSNSSW